MAPDLNSLPPSTTSLPRATSDSPSPLSSVRSGSRIMQAINTQAASPSPHRASGDTTPVSPSPRQTSISLQAAATLNAGLQRNEPPRRESNTLRSVVDAYSTDLGPATPQSPSSLSRQSPTRNRRRSQVLHGLQLADPSVPSPGEMVGDTQQTSGQLRNPSISGSPIMLPSHWDPHHTRTPSLGELHQELENEQEFQVNRLLQEIRRLQAQVQRQQSGQGQSAILSDEASSDRDVSIPTGSTPQSAHPPALPSGSLPRSPGFAIHPRSSFDIARADLHRRSRTPSRGASPRLRSASISGDSGEHWILGGRDETAFYQAETQMLSRENQMLKRRVHELGKLLHRIRVYLIESATNRSPMQSDNSPRLPAQEVLRYLTNRRTPLTYIALRRFRRKVRPDRHILPLRLSQPSRTRPERIRLHYHAGAS